MTQRSRGGHVQYFYILIGNSICCKIEYDSDTDDTDVGRDNFNYTETDKTCERREEIPTCSPATNFYVGNMFSLVFCSKE